MDMVCYLVIGVGVGGGTAMGAGTATGAGTDGSVINLGAMTLFELRLLRRKYRVTIESIATGSGIPSDSRLERLRPERFRLER
jgi:hypothetical protein